MFFFFCNPQWKRGFRWEDQCSCSEARCFHLLSTPQVNKIRFISFISIDSERRKSTWSPLICMTCFSTSARMITSRVVVNLCVSSAALPAGTLVLRQLCHHKALFPRATSYYHHSLFPAVLRLVFPCGEWCGGGLEPRHGNTHTHTHSTSVALWLMTTLLIIPSVNQLKS